MRTNQTLCAILAAMTPMLWAVTAAAAANTIDPGGAPVIAVDRDDYRGPAPTESFLQKAGRKTGDFFTDYVEIGLALNFYFPVDDQRSPDDTYLGTIDELKLTTGPLSINSLRVQFLLPKDFRIELSRHCLIEASSSQKEREQSLPSSDKLVKRSMEINPSTSTRCSLNFAAICRYSSCLPAWILTSKITAIMMALFLMLVE